MGRRGIGSNGAGSGGAGTSGPGSRGSSPDGPVRSQSGSRAAPKKPGHGATYSVAVMTLAALAGVGVLAAQAAATAPKVSTNATAKNSGAPTHQPGKGTPSGAGSASASAPDPLALPANSGSGQRIVYGEAAKRVWLVSGGNTVARTFLVVPGNVAAPTGSFKVTNRLSTSAGTDGTPIQYVVLFNNAKVNHVHTTFGFDAVANVTGLPPAPSGRTGGIRMAQADAQALWNFSNFGTTVVVVP
jgi:hypothetical protein